MGKFNSKLFISIALLATLGSGCAEFSNSPSREIAAQQSYQELMQNPKYNTAFNEIFSDQDATKRYLEFFTRLGRMYYRNQALINDFDEQLEQGKDPMKSTLYQEIWVARNLKDRLEDKMTFHVLKLRELELTGSEEEAKKSRIILGTVSKILNRLEDHEKVPFIDVIEEINSYSRSIPSHSKKGRSDKSMENIIAPFGEFLRPGFSWEEFYDENAGKIQKATNEQVRNKGFYKEIEKAGDSSRNPDSLLIFPSTGKEGNIFGHRFERGTWALTFDDGPRRETTSELLEYLHDNDFKATFFWLAQNAKRYPDMIRLAQDYDMELANHSFSHANVPKLSRGDVKHEILESTDTLEALYGQKVKYFRLPYGSGLNNSAIRKMIADRGMIHVYWSVDSLDWQDKDPRKIFNRVKKQMEHDGRGIILFHDIHGQSVEASKLVVQYAKREGLRFRGISGIVDELNNKSDIPAPKEGYRVMTDLNVRVGYSTGYSKCAVLPGGTYVKVIDRQGSYVRIEVINPSANLENDLRNCGGNTMVHSDYIERL